MGKDLVPENHGDQGIGPQRTKRPGNRFQPYGTPRERPPEISNPGLEIPRLPRQNEGNSESLPELHDVEQASDSDPVEAYDVAWNQKAAAKAKASDYEKWNTAPAEFIRSYSGLGHGWVGKRPLGAGGFGMAGLWEKYDGNGTVIEVNSMFSTHLTRICDRLEANGN